MGFRLTTDRLILRDFEPADFDRFYATTDDPEYRQYYPEEEMTREAMAAVFDVILPDVDGTERTGYQLAVCRRSGGLIGTCGVRIEDPIHRQASLGCAIARAFWGQGYAEEACLELIDFGFSDLQIHRLFADTNAENRRSRALLERMGFRLEAEFVDHRFFTGRWWNTVVYATTEDEWRSFRSADA